MILMIRYPMHFGWGKNSMVASIDEIVRNGVLFDLKNWGKKMPNDDLAQSIAQLFSFFAERKIDYLLVGGVALLSYVEGRNTQDVDFILARQDLLALPELVVQEENRDFARASFSGIPINLFLTDDPLFSLVGSQYGLERQFGDLKIWTSSAEGLVLLKLYALPSLYRQGRFDRVSIYESDILLLLLRYPMDMHRLIDILSAHVLPSDLTEIKQVVADIERRMQRFRPEG
jgi:hypothetical protein